ncbi:F0F1 ATP synthase subunit B [Calycomorphotria hydatis]|uniref:ATP synthase subunit b n=1 Tax=Calycomorphotria hydatis TaxID=2528027 RepID=A0A517T6I3_9PLAN|nr:F0F1 ATP synthase subunit B [Calycomorphotria hydatis]QDT63968.1 ATP synthase subunit b [Calycomorphotria hydatis]
MRRLNSSIRFSSVLWFSLWAVLALGYSVSYAQAHHEGAALNAVARSSIAAQEEHGEGEEHGHEHEHEEGESHHDAESHDAGDHGDEHHLGVQEAMAKDANRPDLAVWTGIVFLCFLVVLTKLAWKPMVTALDARENRVRKDIADAEAARVKAEQMLADHKTQLDKVQDEVKEILAEARRDAETAKNNILAEAKSEADALKDRAVTDIERAKDHAMKELFDRVNDRVVELSGYVLGRSMNDDDHRKLIDEAMGNFESHNASKT